MPAILVILLSFILIVVLMRLRIPLFGGIIFGCLLLGIYEKIPAPKMWLSFLASLLDGETISLVVLIVLITLFSLQLQVSGALTRLVESANSVIGSRRLRLAMFPALIGLLPMPGGAIFSAPMVEEAGKALPLNKTQLTAINYWFRHIWEFWWPMYPGVLLAVSLTQVSLPLFIVFMLPLTFVAVLLGVATMFRGLGKANNDPGLIVNASPQSPHASRLGRFFVELTPVTIAVVGSVVLESLRELLISRGYPLLPQVPRAGMVVAILLPIVVIGLKDLAGLRKSLREWFSRGNTEMLLAVIAVMWYRQILSESGIADKAVKELIAMSIPLSAVIFLLPFIGGLITGINVAGVGVSFPIVIGLAKGAGIPMLATAVFAYSAVHMGVMVSPIHFCLILTKEYFKSDYGKVYALVAPSVIVVLLSAWAIAKLVG